MDCNLVYLNKVFYDESQNSSPLLTSLTTTCTTFTQQVNIGSHICDNVSNYSHTPCNTNCGCNSNCGCNTQCNCNTDCCCNMTISSTSEFTITNSYVVVHSFDLTTPDTLAASAVTVNGIAVTSITAGNGQYTADISGIMSEITKCACKSACEQTCPGSFLMVTGAGPWSLNATIVVEGYVSDGGNTCQFRACFNTATGESTSVTGAASFALCGVDIPCQISGIAPSLLFSFDACSSILNPQLSVTTCNGSNALQLTGSLVTTPSINMKITRQSLFQIHACEVDAPCDDLGQCDPCNPDHEDCFEDSDNCCCGYGSSSNSNGHCGQNYL